MGNNKSEEHSSTTRKKSIATEVNLATADVVVINKYTKV